MEIVLRTLLVIVVIVGWVAVAVLALIVVVQYKSVRKLKNAIKAAEPVLQSYPERNEPSFDRLLEHVKEFYGFFPYNHRHNLNKGNELFMEYLYSTYGKTRVYEAVNALKQGGYNV